MLKPRRTAEKTLIAVIQAARVQGISTRSVDEPAKATGMIGITKSQAWRQEIDERVQGVLGAGDRGGTGPISGSTPPPSR